MKILIFMILVNQIFILISNDSIRKGWWKSNSENRLNEHDFLEFDKNLNWNIINEKGKNSGIIQLYIGKKILISNFTFTEWYWYENKG